MKKDKISIPVLLGNLFSLLLKNCKYYTLSLIILCALVGLGTAANTLFKQWFFEAVSASAYGAPVATAVWWGVFLGLFLVVTLALHGVSDVFMDNLGLRLSGFLGRVINEKAARIDPVCFENTDMLNDINKAYQGVQNAGNVMRIALTNLAFYIPYFIFFAVYLYRIEPLLCFGVLLVFVPTLGGQWIRTRYYQKLEDKAAPVRRRYEYFERCIVDREYAKETRLLGAFWFFRNLYETNLLLFQKEQWKTRSKSELVELGLRMIGLLVYVLILWLLYHYLSVGVIHTAIFAAVFTSIDQMFNYMDYVGYGMSDISSNLPAVHNAMRFLQLPERQGKAVTIKDYAIMCNNVSFCYPNTDKNAVQNVSLTIKKGQTVAIVGENGAGKSTLVKLLTGLYIPTNGEITIDGHDTKDISIQSITSGTSAVFQKFQRYKMTLAENISISQTLPVIDSEKLHMSLQKADMPIDHRSFTNGVETMLSREFDGVDLSGGQWQRIAIGRGFYRSHDMIILDEPTAAIDPIEETRIYKQFAELSKGKTAIIITHRLGSAKIADCIIVMENGEILDIGTHDELMANGGVYNRMYNSQAKWYV